ncbi:MAG TPA: hypothetical protein DD730_17340 [Desulfosporosinus sp.]|nr:hypothetical protein [Desulfosporosinus sp.]
MEENSIRKAWYEMDKLFGPSCYGQDIALKDIAQIYVKSILEASDENRIKHLGMKHLKLMTNRMLNGKKFSLFLSHVIRYERFLQ